MTENLDYKHSDYSIRARDPYAFTKYQIIMGWLPKTQNLRVLNAGCGSGEMSALLAENSTWQVDAIDVDPEAIRLSALLKQDRALSNLTVTQSSIEDHPGRGYDI